MSYTTEVIQWMITGYILGEVLGWTLVQVRAKVRRDYRP